MSQRPAPAYAPFEGFKTICRYGQWLSIDVAMAALGGGIMAQRLTGARVRPAFYLVLPLAVWSVYTLDHLLDGRRVGGAASTPRHRIHYQYAKPLWIGFGLAAALTLVLALDELSRTAVYFGIGMCGLVVAHLVIVKLAGSRTSPLLIKELGVAMIFTAGVWGLPVLRHTIDPWPVEALVQYFLLALANLIIFATFERDIDEADGHTSFVRFAGAKTATAVTATVLLAQIPIGVSALVRFPGRVTLLAEVLLFAMALVLGATVLKPAYFREHERYRTWGDGAFLLPLLLTVIS